MSQQREQSRESSGRSHGPSFIELEKKSRRLHLTDNDDVDVDDIDIARLEAERITVVGG